jgi:hypothetical protein
MKGLRFVLVACCAALVAPTIARQPDGVIRGGDPPAIAQGKPRLGVKLISSPDDNAPGAIILEVISGFAAEASGLQNGDRVTRIGDDAVVDTDAFRDAISKMNDGDTRVFVVYRDEAPIEIPVKLTAPRPDAPGQRPPTNPALRDELLRLRETDQAGRRVLMDGSAPEAKRQKIMEEMRETDARNRARLKEIIAQHGFPTVSMVGEDAAGAAFLILQHADAEPEFQQRMLPVVEQLATKGEASKTSVAYLTDRVRNAQNQPQWYATQYTGVPQPDGTIRFNPPVVEDPANLDKRRRAMGLEPWSMYEARMAEMQGREPFERVRGPGE